MPIGDYPHRLYVGHSFLQLDPYIQEGSRFLSKNETKYLIERTKQIGLDFIVIPIDISDSQSVSTLKQTTDDEDFSVDALTRKSGNIKTTLEQYKLQPTTGSDLALQAEVWNNNVMLSMSPWICLDPFVPDNPLVNHSLQAFHAQLAWASHCSVYSVILPIPQLILSNENWICPNFCQALSQNLTEYLQTRVWVRIPLIYRVMQTDPENPDTRNTTALDGWSVWHHIASVVAKPHLLGVALYLTSTFPKDSNVYNRWIAEPVQALIIPTYLFRINSTNQTVLPKPFKDFILTLLRHGVQLIFEHSNACLLSSTTHTLFQNSHTNIAPENLSFEELCLDTIRYRECIKQIHDLLPPLTPTEEFEQPCLDQLQCPLQPLRDNLEAQTYETFERDPVKYRIYKQAIQCCLADRIVSGRQFHVIMVVGAGRGPLVHAVLLALKDLKIPIKNCNVIALEKNHNAAITLRHRVAYDTHPLWRYVTVVEDDMRKYNPSDKADILISELLGSFGDNELSPECLDGAQRFLREDGVSIPCSYFSSLEPVMSSRLWNSAKSMSSKGLEGLETAYVVKIHRAFYLSKEGAQPCFTFEHPNAHIQHDNSHNSRYKQISFTCNSNSVCHGFAGYFHCTLYKTITMSTHPETASKDMISWFPLFFPLHQPLFVEENQHIEVHFWRCSNKHRVWYEWSLTSPISSAIHNVNGQSFSIEL